MSTGATIGWMPKTETSMPFQPAHTAGLSEAGEEFGGMVSGRRFQGLISGSEYAAIPTLP